jgi:hypothetical protein
MISYSQSKGLYTFPDGSVSPSYSGFGAGLNNPAMENAPDVGPIPQGVYDHGAPLAVGPGHTGEYVIPLIPDAATRARIIAMGRGPDSFFNHGDTASDIALNLELASRGCIISGRMVRVRIASMLDQITVTA